jgi:NAD-dependent DNA ligase
VVRASELQHPEKYPLVAKAIESERRAIVERYKCTQERSLSTLARIRDKASESGNWNAAVAAETRRGQIAGLYVDKKEILTGTIDSMSRDEVEKKLQDLKEQYSIETTFEEVKELENKS